MGHERFQLGAEHHDAVRKDRVVQRLDAHPVASQEQRLGVGIPQREREHAAKALDTALTPRLPSVHDDFRVAARVELVTEGLQLGNQLLVVVDLAVEDDDDGAVLVVERLLTGRDVDDGQPPMPQGNPGCMMLAAAIGSAMLLQVVHPAQQLAVQIATAANVDHAGDSAHQAVSSGMNMETHPQSNCHEHRPS